MTLNGSIILDGMLWTSTDILHLNMDDIARMPEWKQEIFLFLQQWFGCSDTISVHTSGSTGKPQQIYLSKSTMRHSAQATNQYFRLNEDSHALLCLSAGYIAGKMMLVRAIEGAYHLHTIAPTSVPLRNDVGHIDFCAMVPMQVEETIRTNGKNAFKRIKQLIIGGGAISHQLEQEIAQLSTICYATYGMTETASHVALRIIDGSDSAFLALPGIHFSTDKRQCLIIDAPELLNHPIVTNDIVELSEDSSVAFRWKGRYDFVVNSGGVKLFPETIEKKIAPLMVDRSFYLTKRPDNRLGEMLILVIEGTPYTDKETQKLMHQIASAVAPYEKPRDIVFLNHFQRSGSGKIIRLKSA